MTTHTFAVRDSVDLAANANLVFITQAAICPVIRINQFGEAFTVTVWLFGAQIEIDTAANDSVILVSEHEFSRLMARHGGTA